MGSDLFEYTVRQLGVQHFDEKTTSEAVGGRGRTREPVEEKNPHQPEETGNFLDRKL